jgi:hypothetical protein
MLPICPKIALGRFSNCQTATAAMQFNMAGKTLDGIHLKPETYEAWTTVLA